MHSSFLLSFALLAGNLLAIASAQEDPDRFSNDTFAEDLVCGEWKRIAMDPDDPFDPMLYQGTNISFYITDINYFFQPIGAEQYGHIAPNCAYVGKMDLSSAEYDIMLQTTTNETRLEQNDTLECVFVAMVSSSEHKAFSLTGELCKNVTSGLVMGMMQAVHQNTDPVAVEELWGETSGTNYYNFEVTYEACSTTTYGKDMSDKLTSEKIYKTADNRSNQNVRTIDLNLPTTNLLETFNYGLFYGVLTYNRPDLGKFNPYLDDIQHTYFGAYHGYENSQGSGERQKIHVVMAATFYTKVALREKGVNTISFGGQLIVGEDVDTDLKCNFNFFRYDICGIGFGPEDDLNMTCGERNTFNRNQILLEKFIQPMDKIDNPYHPGQHNHSS
eukprot:m.338649 g.338649  ORF g.338649 m.338649 type:complete len:387 (+) comp18493_c0_seq1:339-1499(+)